MAHIGKLYPVWNPGRIYSIDAPWPLYLPTEFKWQVDAWSGPIGTGAPTTGRAFVPTAYNPAAGFVRYQMALSGIAGPLFFPRLELRIDATGLLLAHDFSVIQAGSNQITTHTFTYPPSDCGNIQMNRFFQYDVPAGSAAYPASFFYILSYLWTDPPPKPGPSRPF